MRNSPTRSRRTPTQIGYRGGIVKTMKMNRKKLEDSLDETFGKPKKWVKRPFSPFLGY